MKLTQHGSFDESLESAMRDQLLFEFEEAELIMDFARCQRPNGSFYGIAEGLQCRKGSKVAPAEKVAPTKPARGGRKADTAARMAAAYDRAKPGTLAKKSSPAKSAVTSIKPATKERIKNLPKDKLEQLLKKDLTPSQEAAIRAAASAGSTAKPKAKIKEENDATPAVRKYFKLLEKAEQAKRAESAVYKRVRDTSSKADKIENTLWPKTDEGKRAHAIANRAEKRWRDISPKLRKQEKTLLKEAEELRKSFSAADQESLAKATSRFGRDATPADRERLNKARRDFKFEKEFAAAQAKFDRVRSKLTDSDIAAVNDYTGEGRNRSYTELNKFLRGGGKPDDSENGKFTRELDAVLAKLPANPKGVPHYRGMSNIPDELYSQLSSLAKGSRLVDPGFGSYSRDLGGTNSYVRNGDNKVVIINRNKGLKSITGMSGFAGEMEAILPRGTETTVLDSFKTKDGTLYLEVE